MDILFFIGDIGRGTTLGFVEDVDYSIIRLNDGIYQIHLESDEAKNLAQMNPEHITF